MGFWATNTASRMNDNPRLIRRKVSRRASLTTPSPVSAATAALANPGLTAEKNAAGRRSVITLGLGQVMSMKLHVN